MIRGYPQQPSPRPGEPLTLHVATDAPQFRVEFYRCGADLVRHGDAGWQRGQDVPPHLPFQDWGVPGQDLQGRHLEAWPAYEFPIPHDWPSGVYLAVLIEGDGQGGDRSRPDPTTPDGREAKALFVVRPARPAAAILYKIPLLTYHAYDVVDGTAYDPATGRGSWCLYNSPRERLPEAVPATVHLHRPGGGTGGRPWDIFNADPFDPTPRQSFVHWDAPFLSWLERSGYPVDHCTDVDLHREGTDLLAPYQLLVSAGHDEYWSDRMRAAAEAHVASGGNLAFFGGNTCWWRVVFDEEYAFRRTAPWWEEGRPENSLIGVSFRHGGERDNDEHPVPVGYRVQHADHWAFAGTGLRDGEVFGDRPDEYLIGYECDGALFDRDDLEAGRPVTPLGTDGTPLAFTILGVGDTRPSGWGNGNAAATMGLYTVGRSVSDTVGRSVSDTVGGTVFNAATTDWPRLLAGGRSPAVEQITRNVLDRLSRR